MNANVRIIQVLHIDTPECTSAYADNSSKAISPKIACVGRKWSWIIVTASFCNQFVAIGIMHTLGLYNVEFLEAFEDSKSKTAWVTSIAGTCIFGLSPLCAAIMDRTSARVTACIGGVVSTVGLLMSWFASSVIHLLITFGVIMGFGLSMIYLSSQVIVGQYFEERRAFASAIASCGASFGYLIIPVFINYIRDEYTWRGSLFLLAALCFQTMVFSCILRPAPTSKKTDVNVITGEPEKFHKKSSPSVYPIEMSGASQNVATYQGSETDSAFYSDDRTPVVDGGVDVKSSSTRSIIRRCLMTLKNKILQNPLSNLGMLLFSVSLILDNIGIGFVAINVPDFIYVTLGSKTLSAVMLMCNAAGRIGGAMIASVLGNWKPLHCLHMHCASTVLMALVAFLFTVSANAYVFGILHCLIGIGFGSAIAWVSQVAVNLLGKENLAQTLGYMLAACGLGRLTGPPIGGALFDISGDYLMSFWLAAGVLLAGVQLPIIALLRERCRKQYDVTKSEPQS